MTSLIIIFFFFNDTATTEIYTLSLHDALPIYRPPRRRATWCGPPISAASGGSKRPSTSTRPPKWGAPDVRDRKSTRLNSSHQIISYAVFCLKKKKLIRDLSYVVDIREDIHSDR